MPKEITTTVYTYAELLQANSLGVVSNQAVERAREWLIQASTDGEWWYHIYDVWKQALDEVGFERAEITFSGFWSQGDGASFTARINVEKLARFLSTHVNRKDCIEYDGESEHFLPWVVHELDGKVTVADYRRLVNLGDWCYARVERDSSRYVHENTCTARIFLEGRNAPLVDGLLRDFQKDVEELRYKLCKAIYRNLQEEYDALCEEESLLELAEANEYTFTATGKRFG